MQFHAASLETRRSRSLGRTASQIQRRVTHLGTNAANEDKSASRSLVFLGYPIQARLVCDEEESVGIDQATAPNLRCLAFEVRDEARRGRIVCVVIGQVV